jgi:gamma-carbonic anhydrase
MKAWLLRRFAVLIEHDDVVPRIADDVYVAPTAVISGDVEIGRGSRVLFGAVITSDGGPVSIGEDCIVMENAIIRGRSGHGCSIGNRVLVGPHSHINGAVVDDEVFLATGSSVFPGAGIGARAEVRINGVVHVNSRLEEYATVPIGWIAVGDPAELFPPGSHRELWQVQKDLDFVRTVYGVERGSEGSTPMPEITRLYSQLFGRHLEDRILE